MRKRIFTRLAAGLLCGALLFTDAASLNVWAVSNELDVEQTAPLEEPASAEETAEEEAKNPDQEADDPEVDDATVIDDSEEATLPVEEEQASLSENTIEEEQDPASENTTEEEANVISVMEASDEEPITQDKSNGISWVIDADGKLTVTGNGDWENKTVDSHRWTPWYDHRESIKTAEIDVTNMTDASYMFYDCENLSEINLTNFRSNNVTNMASMFSGCINLTELELSNFQSGSVTDMSEMFYGCESLTTLEAYGLITGSVTSMRNMFAGCTALTHLDLGGGIFSDSNVTDMSGMFQGCSELYVLKFPCLRTDSLVDISNMFSGCGSLQELNLNDFYTDHVTNMKDMFSGCFQLKKLDLSNLDTGSVTDQESMFDFDDCNNLTVIYTPRKLKHSVKLPGGTWYRSDGTTLTELPKDLNYSITLKKNETPENIAEDTSGDVSWVIDANGKLTLSGTGDLEKKDDYDLPWRNYYDSIKTAEVTVTGMKDASFLFYGCRYLTSIDFTNFDTSNVTDMKEMFSGCQWLEKLDLDSFNTSNVTDMRLMFHQCYKLTTLDLRNFDTSNVTDMGDMFSRCNELTSLILSSFNTCNVTNMSYMFHECRNLPVLDLINFKTGNVTDMRGMFFNCNELTTLDLSSFDTGSVTDMGDMFGNCTNLTTLNVISFNTDSVTNMSSMFSGCKNLRALDVNHFTTSSVTDMSWMFNNCANLTTLDLSKFNTGGVTNMHNMFNLCANLTTLNVSKFNTSNVTNMGSMFWGCENLDTLDLSSFDTGSVTNMSNMFYKCAKLTTIYTPRNVRSNVNLPSDPRDTWYRSDGTIVTQLPRDLNYSVALGRNYTPTDPEKPDDPKEPEEPKEPGNITSGESGKIAWAIADGKLTVSGTGDFERIDVGSGSMRAPWYHARKEIKTAVINVTGMSDVSYMFYECENLTDIDLQNFSCINLTSMASMFYGCKSLTTLNLSNLDIGSVTDMNGMFSGCSKLATIHTPRNVKQSVELPSEPGDKWYLSDGTVVTELPRDLDYSVVLIKNHNPNEGKPDTPDDAPKGDNDSDILDEDIPEDGVIPNGLWISKIADQTYTSAAIKPEVRVYEGETKLKQGTDYTLSYKNNTMAAGAADAKPPTVVMKGKGNYSGTETKTFTIAKRDISDIYVTKTFTDAYTPLANGKNPTLVFSAKCNKSALKKNTDYALTVKDSAGNEVTSYAAEGTYLAVVKGIGANYTGEYSFPFEVLNKIPVSKLKISKIAAVKYDGTSKTPEPVIKYGKVTLNKETDYSLSYHDNTEIGTATVTVEGKGEYFGKRDVSFSITGLPIKQAKFTGFIKSFPYTGDKVYQSEAVLTYGEEKLVKDTDYTVSYSNCLNKGKAAVTFTGIGKYTGTIKKTYSITAYNIASDAKKRIALSADKISAAYTKGGARPSLKVYDGARLLKEEKDYTLSYQNNTAITTSTTAKQPTITVKGMGNYAGTFSEKKTFTITAKDIAEVTVTVPDVAASTKTGKYKSTPVLTDTDGKKLKAGTDYDKAYTYTYKNTTEKVVNNGAEVTRNAGDPVEENDIIPANTVLCIRIRAKEGGNYTGETTAEYRVATSLISRAKITVQNPAQNNKNLFPYTGQEIRIEKSSLIVKVGTEVLSGDQYEILENTYKNNVGKGTASVQIRGVGNYGGTATVKFKIGTKSFRWVK